MAYRSKTWLAVATAALIGCNSVSGADSIRLDDDEGSSNGSTTSAATTSGNGGAGAGVGGATSTTGSGGTPPPMAEEQAAAGVEVAGIRLYQGPEHILVANRQPQTSDVPLVSGRPGLLRVLYRTTAAYDGQPIVARVSFGASTFDQTITLGADSTAGDFNSSINFSVAGAALDPSQPLRVELLQLRVPTGDPENAMARYPATGSAALVLPLTTGHPVKVTIVPIAWGTDGSNRVPDVSAAHLEVYRKEIMGHYPAREVQLNVRATVTNNLPLGPLNLDQWTALLQAVTNLRASDGAGGDTFYYGVFNPGQALQDFCPNFQCYAGLGWVPGAADDGARASIGFGYAGQESVFTHELGHNHGRQHVNGGCGAGNADGQYPNTTGFLEQVSYNVVDNSLSRPTTHKDFMSYCNPVGVGGYGFRTLKARIDFINGTQIAVPSHLLNRRWARLNLLPSGRVEWLPTVQLARPPGGPPLSMEVERNGTSTMVEGQFRPLADAVGGVLFVLEDRLPMLSRVRVALGATQFSADSTTPMVSDVTLAQ